MRGFSTPDRTPDRTLTELDHVRLTHLLHRHPQGGHAAPEAEAMVDLLEAADVVPSHQVPPDVVTMNSQVLLGDLETGRHSTVTLSYPAETRPGEGRVSALSPVGEGVLGLPVGATARWVSPTGENKGAEILALLYQPEARGDLTR
jgi:regulator of nucleoside diphosphate kinase